MTGLISHVRRYAGSVRLERITIVVDDYDEAIGFFTSVLGFDLVEDSPSLTNDGRPKRWVVVRPPGAETGILLARADGPDQAAVVACSAARLLKSRGRAVPPVPPASKRRPRAAVPGARPDSAAAGP